MTKKEDALQVKDPLVAALSGTLEATLAPQDWGDGKLEEPRPTYLAVRQKDLKDERGKLLRPAGGVRAGSVKEPEGEDRQELMLTVLGSRPGRVYFKTLNDQKPTCRSDDLKNGSAARETDGGGRPIYGKCQDCWLGQWGSAENGRQACRENRRVFAMDWGSERPSILTLGPSSLKWWVKWTTAVQDQARKMARNGRVPFIFNLLRVKIVPEYVAEPAGHFVLKWSMPMPNNPDCEALPLPIQEQMVKLRGELTGMFAQASEAQAYDAGDYVGEAADPTEAAPQGGAVGSDLPS